MIVDQRTYTLKPGAVPAYLKLYETEGMPIQTRHLGQPIGWFFSEIGTINQIVHMWGYENFADREKRRAAMAADPDWRAYTAKAAQYLVTQENKILIPAPFSPIR